MQSHTVDIRVRYQETDQMGVVYYANYFVWFEVARTEFFRASGLDYRQLEEDRKIYLPVVEANCRYRAPIRYDDKVTLTVKLSSVKKARINFEYEVNCGGRLCATGMTEHTFVNSAGAPIPIPAEVKKVLISEV
jgi:acyl-CoA thioester hydrolase